jgi:hypothetical protein
MHYDAAVVRMPERHEFGASVAKLLEDDVLVDILDELAAPGTRVLVRPDGVAFVVDLDDEALDRGESVLVEHSARRLSTPPSTARR